MNDELTADIGERNRPVDTPLGSMSAPPRGPEIRRLWPVTGDDSSAPADTPVPSHTAPNNRAGSHNLPHLKTLLSERDFRILEFVFEHRIVTTRQLQRMFFAGHATVDAGTRACNRVLARLREKRFLHRLERPVGGVKGGSGAFAWMLGAAGDRAIRDRLSIELPRQRLFEPTPLYLAHTLAITEVRVRIEEAARDGRFGIELVQTEPYCWRDYLGAGGTSLTLRPDLSLKTTAGDFEDNWFFEIDRGTESLPTLIRKSLAYERYRASGREQAQTGVFPAVLWLIDSPRRRELLVEAIEADHRLEATLFTVIDPTDLIATLVNRD